MCHMAPSSASPRGELRRYDMFLNFEPHLPVEVGSVAATWPWSRLSERIAPVLPRTHGPSGLWTTEIKKGLAAPDTQPGSHVSKAQSRVTEASVRRADMPLQFSSTMQHRLSWPFLNMATVVIRSDRTAPQR
jgi:hypothetical protein